MALGHTGAPQEGVRRPFLLTPYRRHAGDAVRLMLALAVLALSAIPVRTDSVPVLEEDLFRVLNDLPDAIQGIVWVPMQLGSVGVVPTAALVALLARRRRLAVDLALCGILAWILAKVIKGFFERGRPGVLLEMVELRGDVITGLGFVSGHAAIAAALATAAGPYLGRRQRRLAWALATVVGLARIYVGAHLPLDVVGGFALGWAIAASVHLVLGAPGGRPGPALVQGALQSMGIEAETVEPTAVDARSTTPFRVTTGTGETLFAKVVTREHRDVDLIHRGWRRLVSRWVREKAPFSAPRPRVDHEAALALLAADAGVRTPRVKAIGTFGNGAAVLVEPWVDGRPLVSFTDLDDGVLDDLWAQVAALHRAHLAHGDLTGANVMVGPEGQVWLVDFVYAEGGASPVRLDQDLAELLASLVPVVGSHRAVASAWRTLGTERLAGVTPFLARARRAGESREIRQARHLLGPELRGRLEHDATG